MKIRSKLGKLEMNATLELPHRDIEVNLEVADSEWELELEPSEIPAVIEQLTKLASAAARFRKAEIKDATNK